MQRVFHVLKRRNNLVGCRLYLLQPVQLAFIKNGARHKLLIVFTRKETYVLRIVFI